ncbi:MAG: hypothetical protein U0168_31885 [Nannocystaceae bacterium]
MPITQELFALGQAARRLNDGSEQLNALIARVDALLGQLMIGMDYLHPRPLSEAVSYDREGKRTIELAYLGYCRVGKGYTLAIKTVRVHESKLAIATETPGEFVTLLQAPRRLRYAAVDVLPELVAGLAHQVEEVAGAMERRCATAQALVRRLEAMVGPPAQPQVVQEAAAAATTHSRPTVPYMMDPNAARRR